ncbi:hypothetical protein ACFWQ1_27925 [Streptomyces albidoflavus]
MTGRGRRAVLPPGDHHAELALAPDGLVVRFINKAGYAKEFDFAALPVAEPMQHSLAVVFAAQSRRWTSHRSAAFSWKHLGTFATFLAQLDSPPDDLSDLTSATLKRWRTLHIGSNGGRSTLSTVRTLLRRDARLAAGPAADELARRIPRGRPETQSYGEDEREQIVLTAQRHFRSALMRIRENTCWLESWRAGETEPGSSSWQIGQVLDHLADTGEVPQVAYPGGQLHVKHRTLLGGASPAKTWGRLFLTRQEITSLAVLLTDRFAWNLAVYDRLSTPTTSASIGETTSVTYQMRLEKRRAGGGRWFSTENVTDSGADTPGRLITQALEATAHGRSLATRLAPETDLLMVARIRQLGPGHQDMDRPRPAGPLVFGISKGDVDFWVRFHRLSGSPFRRVRRTTVIREGRPLQHSQGTHESVYVLPDEHVQRASRSVFEQGAVEALKQAQAAVFGGHLTEGPEPVHEETVTADCSDQENSPWPSPEGGCGADFLLCLGCPNAYIHPGHHPRLAHLHQQVESLRAVLDDRAWNERWSDHLLRLEDLRGKVGPAAWSAALARVTDNDRSLVQLLVKGDLAP